MDRPIFFVLGLPGSGKGTACSTISDKFGYAHLSAGDLLRAEQQREGSENARLIKEYIASGRIVPPEITLDLIKQAVYNDKSAKGFLIDGFPREVEQFTHYSYRFDTARTFLIEVTCDVAECWRRISARNQGRIDDNEDTFKVRVSNYQSETTKVVKLFEEFGKLLRINGNSDKSAVVAEAESSLAAFLKQKRLA